MATLNRGTLLRVFLYIVIAVLPLALGLIDLDPGRGFWINFSVALGFVGLSMFGLQFLLAARSRIVANHVGMDRLLEFHKQMSYVATLFVFAHPIILFFVDTRFLGLLDFFNAPLRAQFAVTSVAVLVIMIALSIWRKQLHIRYETWQVWHAILALTVVITALLHVILVGYYVRDPWETVLWIALSIAFVALGLWVRIIKPLLRHRRKWQVESVEPAPGGAHTITLTLVNPQAYGPGGFRFKAGQFAWITARRSAFSMTYHPFSFSSSAELHNRVRFTIKTQEGFTTNIGELQPGEIVYLDGPYGSFALPDEKTAGPLILIGAGVGVTPLQSMLETLADRGSSRHCEIWLANRNQDSITGGAELAALEPRLDLTIRHVLSRPSDGWDGETGRLDADFVKRHLPSDAALGTYFLCGPGGLMDAAIAALVSSGVPRANIHAERFDMV